MARRHPDGQDDMAQGMREAAKVLRESIDLLAGVAEQLEDRVRTSEPPRELDYEVMLECLAEADRRVYRVLSLLASETGQQHGRWFYIAAAVGVAETTAHKRWGPQQGLRLTSGALQLWPYERSKPRR